jgi:hypothetical protein
MISPRQQWLSDGDLVDVERDVRVALDYDLKRQPDRVGERHGCLLIESTVPWQDRAKFLNWREDLSLWRSRTGRILKTAGDWADFLSYREALVRTDTSRREARGLSPFVRMLMGAWDRGEAGLPRDRSGGRGRGGGWSRVRIAAALSESTGAPITAKMVEKAGAVPLQPVENLSEHEAQMLARLVAMVPGVRVTELCRTPPEALVDSFPEIGTAPKALEMLDHQQAETIASPSATGGVCVGGGYLRRWPPPSAAAA